jgi:hypothetical protein
VSDDLYYTILRWADGAGIVKGQGMKITLASGPDLGKGPVHFVAYRPEIGRGEVQTHPSEPRRPMDDIEVRAATQLIRAMTTLPEVPR